jgi:selenocysteine-specific elongation factor
VHVVTTAGHVDHGKSTLVRALTGTDPDRLEEERRRGLSIQLGYAWTELPEVGDVAFVDVPGHERFLATTLSGMGPVPVAMLVVAADDPWMPQAAEHLAALDALGVQHGLLVVTRADLADPGPALERARAELARTTLHAVPAVAVSGRTGAGLAEMRVTLGEVLRRVPPADPDADVRLWVDRRFHVPGAGTVVTGTLPAGTISRGDRLEADGQEIRVRAVETLGRPVPTVHGVARVALDLAGKVPDTVGRGSVLAARGAFESSAVVDVRLTGDSRLPERPVLHVGAANLSVRARPLADDLVRLTLDRPLPLRIGDRAILRDPGSRAMWGVRVLDPLPPPLRRRGAAAARAKDLAGADGTTASELARRGLARRSVLRRIGAARTALPSDAVVAGDWAVSAERAAELRSGMRELVGPGKSPLHHGLVPGEVANALGLPDAAIVRALVAPPLSLDRGRIVRESRDALPAATREALEALHTDLAEVPFRAPEATRLAELGLDVRTVAALHRAGHLLRLADGVVLLPGADALAAARLRALAQPFTAAEARRALQTSRRVVLPLLAHLDRTGRTVRLPDDRRRLRES